MVQVLLTSQSIIKVLDKPGEILTVPVGGLTGIPTSGTFNQFELDVQKVFSDEFTGWSIGVLQVLDDPSVKFDGVTKAFNLTLAGTKFPLEHQEDLK
jgi:hypothetical protein